jgi:hypothetical protein
VFKIALASVFVALLAGGIAFFSWLAYRFWIGDCDVDQRIDRKIQKWFRKEAAR